MKLFQKLEKMDDNNMLEVEDLIKLVHIGNSDFVKPLQVLRKNHNWLSIKDNLTVGDNKRLIPFGTWVDVISVYLKGGINGVLECALKKDELFSFSIAVLEELKSLGSFKASSTILQSCAMQQEECLIIDAVSAINMIASFNHPPEIDKETAAKTTGFIQEAIGYFDSVKPRQNDKVALCLLSLRGIGDASTIKFIQKLPQIAEPEHYVGVEKITIRAIKTRLPIK